MDCKSESKQIILALSIVIGLSLLGFFIFKGLKTFSDKDRIVTVKGLAEMNMTATSATVTLHFSFSGDTLQDIIAKTESKKNAIVTYMTNNGYDAKDITIKQIGVNDRQKYYEPQWVDDKQVQVKIDRDTISQSITFESKDVKSIEDKVAQLELELVSNDLTCTISTDYYLPELN